MWRPMSPITAWSEFSPGTRRKHARAATATANRSPTAARPVAGVTPNYPLSGPPG
jgi:hypothetical protein